MYKDFVMQTFGIELAPLLSLILFVSVFTFTSVRALTMSKARVKEFGNMPLDDNNADLNTDYTA